MSSIAKFRVFGRVRPFIDSEIEGKATGEIRSIVEMTGNRTVLLDPKDNYSPKAQFEFDDSLWSIPTDYKFLHVYAENTKKEFASQLYVYNLVAKACPEDAFNGINSTIMTYGQTGGGKTYTMMGKYDPFSVCGGEGEEGIIPRVCHDVFLLVEAKRKEIEKLKDEDRWDIAVEVTFVEIYMEKVRDLLDRQAARTGEMREARIRVDTSGPFVEDVTKYRVSNWKHCCTLLEQGSSMRTTSANVVHQQSSRSHAIFTLTIVQNKTIPAKDKYSLPTVETKVGRINLVDLAGSERGGFTDYVKESSKINTSLLSLRRVIDTLVERQRIMMEQVSAEISGVPIRGPPQQPPAVPYRDSVLTWLLSDSMGGNARTTMVAALSPHEKNFNDTLATLQWSSKARNLVGVVKVNDSQSNVQSGMLGKRTDLQSSIHQHRQSVDALRQELESAKIGAAEYHRKALALKKEYLAQLSQLGNVKETAAAVMVQLALRKSLHRARVNKLQSQLKQGLTAIADKEAALVAATAAAAAATAALVASEAEIGVLSADVASKEARVETYNADEAAFSVKYEEAQMLRREGEVAVNQRRDELAAIAQQIDADHKAALATVATARERHDSDTKKLAALQAEIAAVSQEDQDRWKREAEELEAANSKKEQERVAPLRKRKDELLAQKKDLQAKIDAKKKK